MTTESRGGLTPGSGGRQPLAIVGMACRFPGGADNPGEFWRFLCKGGDAIREAPANRWDLRRYYDPDPRKAGKFSCREAGFLDEAIDEFDPQFFGISPREAASMDPQQRLLLETAWEAFEDAGWVEDRLDGSNTGVFVGGFCMDHELIQSDPSNRDFADAQMATGSSKTMLAARLSYVFNLRGPSVAIDTACSSSLVATHYACQSLWDGECELALAGGVNLLLDPSRSMAMARGGFLASDGRCRAFDAKASGYVRSEGAGIVLLKPLQRAMEDGDSIYALILNSGVNQDGRTPGITLPDPTAQADLISDVYSRAGIQPGAVQYIEAHGTGTQAGDLAEASAIHEVLSHGRGENRDCIVGSVKTNIGHMEAAAGIGGLIKATLALKHGQIPPNLHFEQPNPSIPFDDYCIRVPTELEPFPEWGDRKYAGVNSFGYGGTNAHVLLCSAPLEFAGETRHERESRPELVPISARGEAALAAVAERYEVFGKEESGATPGDFANAAALRRSHHPFRACVVAETREELSVGLASLAQGVPHEGVVRGRVLARSELDIAFVYTGMGPQWWAMGRELMEREGPYRTALEEVDSHFAPLSGWSLVEKLSADESASEMGRAEVAQPANFALQVGLTELWRAWGVEPEAVIGHSAGEVAAAYVAGALTLEDAVSVIYHRSRLQQKAAGRGSMLAVSMKAEEAENLLRDYEGVSIAAFNSPSMMTFSGEHEPLRRIAARLEVEKVFHRLLRVEVAYHSHQMEFLKSEVLGALSGITPRSARIPLHSTVTGLRASGEEWNAAYWWKNIREPVRFAHGTRSLLAEGYDALVEIGPNPDLTNAIRESQIESGDDVPVFPSLYRKKPERRRMLETLGELYVLGVPVKWSRVVPVRSRSLRLPSYPFQRESYWHESDESQRKRRGGSGHVFLDQRIGTPEPTYEMDLTEGFLPYLNDHEVDGTVIFPAAGFLEAALALATAENGSDTCVLSEVTFDNPLVIDAASSQVLRVAMDSDRRRFTVYSRTRGVENSWRQHAAGRLAGLTTGSEPRSLDVDRLMARFGTPESADGLYESLTTMGLTYGSHFRRIRSVAVTASEVLAEITQPQNDLCDEHTLIHPTVLDASVQSLVALIRDSKDASRPFIPVSVKRLHFMSRPEGTVWAYGQIRVRARRFVVGDITVFDQRGRIVAELEGLHCRQVPGVGTSALLPAELHYCSSWGRAEVPEQFGGGDRKWFVVGREEDGVREVVEKLRMAGHEALCASIGQGDDRAPESMDVKQLFQGTDRADLDTVLYLTGGATAAPCEEQVTRECVRLLHLFQSLTGEESPWNGTLGIVTRGTQRVANTDDACDPAGAEAWGLARVMRLEYPQATFRTVDLSCIPTDTEWSRLLDCVAGGSEEMEWALRGDDVFVHRLVHAEACGTGPSVRYEPRGCDQSWCLDVETPGLLDGLYYRECDVVQPGDEEVAVKVHTASLNFKDTLKALGRLSPEVVAGSFSEDHLGLECSGTVTAIGPNVGALQVGDEVVVGIARNALGSHVVAPARFAVRRPGCLKVEEAPVLLGFLTAWLGLVDAARLRKGERVLIHSATGGVGLAAIQIARWLGAEVIATAGSEEKRAYLRESGVEHVMDSRDLCFAEQIRTTMGGVDVVFNTLEGEALFQSFELLNPYGRFIEIGKGEILRDAGLPMAVFNRNVSFAALDLDRVAAERPEEIERLLQEVLAGFEDGRFRPIPVECFEATDVEGAFRRMASAAHIGKVVVRMEGQEVPVRVSDGSDAVVREDGTYLVTGGTAGFGLEVGEWLARSGAGHVVLASRSGAGAAEASAAIGKLRESGFRITAISLDVTDGAQVVRFMESLARDGEVLRGIVHAAMVLDDDWLANLNASRFTKVLAPKVAGVLNLHEYAVSDTLDFFVSFSSIASLFGSAGQGAYAAANAFLDSFSEFQRSKGVPGMSINWGVLSDVGVVARNPELGRVFESAGIRAIPAVKAVAALEALLQERPVRSVVVDVDWHHMQTARPSLAFSPIVRDLIVSESGPARTGIKVKESKLYREIAELKTDQRLDRMVRFLAEEVARILRLPVDRVDTHVDVTDLGLDSLLAMELITVVERELALRLSTIELMSGASIENFSKRLVAMAFSEAID